MGGKDVSRQIAALGRLCGITSQYWDNFGRRRRTSQATYRDFLSAMGVAWEDPEAREQEIARRRLGAWGALLEPVQLIKPPPTLPRTCPTIEKIESGRRLGRFSVSVDRGRLLAAKNITYLSLRHPGAARSRSGRAGTGRDRCTS